MGQRALVAGLAGFIVLILAVPLGAAAVLGAGGGGSCGLSAAAAALSGGPGDLVAGFDAEQVANAATIVRVGAKAGVPPRGWIIAVAVAISESGLRDLDHGDGAGPDSRGLFQQRAGWGPAGLRMDPAGSALLFYTGGRAGQPGLLDIPGWTGMPLTAAAHDVQHNADPGAYADAEAPATALVAATTIGPVRRGAGTTAPTSAAPAGTAGVQDVSAGARGRASSDGETCAGPGAPAGERALAYARAQLGVPYQWGGDGPGTTRLASGELGRAGGFDCSGLTQAAYTAAGLTIPRTAQAQYDAGPHLPAAAALQPGDLLFFGTPTQVHHVGLYAGGNQMIDAPHTGATVRIEDYRWKDYLGGTRPTARSK